MRAAKLLFTIFLCLFLVSCSHPDCDVGLPLSPYICEISFTSGGEDFTASFASGAVLNGDRDYILRILSPACVSELRAVSSGGASALYYGQSLIGPVPSGYSDIAALLLPISPLKYLCKTELEGVTAVCYISDGVRWYFSPLTGKPIRVEKGALSLDIRVIERS